MHAAGAQRRGHTAAPAKVQRLNETMCRIIQPVEQPLGEMVEKLCHVIDFAGRPITMLPHRRPIKHLNLIQVNALNRKSFLILFSKKNGFLTSLW